MTLEGILNLVPVLNKKQMNIRTFLFGRGILTLGIENAEVKGQPHQHQK